MNTDLTTNRLRLRQWQDSDYAAFAELNADAEVMKYFPDTLSREQSDALIQRVSAGIRKNGWGFWAVEIKHTGRFIGFVGLNTPSAPLPFNPCVEIGWRLARQHWRNGYATEAAKYALHFAFDTLNLNEVVSFTPVLNTPSQKVMQKIGMTNTGQNFTHPNVPAGNQLEEHVLYKITRSAWNKCA